MTIKNWALQQSLKSGKLIPPVPFFFLKIALAIPGVLYFHTNLEVICSSSGKNSVRSLIGIALNLQIALCSILIFTILFLSIHESGIFLHLFVSSLIPFISVLQFSTYRAFVSFSSVSSVAQSCLTPCDHMDYSMPILPVHHQLLHFTQTHVH